MAGIFGGAASSEAGLGSNRGDCPVAGASLSAGSWGDSAGAKEAAPSAAPTRRVVLISNAWRREEFLFMEMNGCIVGVEDCLFDGVTPDPICLDSRIWS